VGRVFLVPATDVHFAWMLGEAPAIDALTLPPGGVDQPDVLRLLRRMAAGLRPLEASWLIAHGEEVVGLCSIKRLPADGVAEIGFGIAAGRRNRGYATQAIGAMLAQLATLSILTTVVATTAPDNIASQTALRRNGFVERGRTMDPDEGELIVWRRGFWSAAAKALTASG
jgi:RimJ/RimL family protein N-acetyltransferase